MTETLWQPTEPYISESGEYRPFPGLKPKSSCARKSENECTGECTFIKDSLGRQYCRGHAGMALHELAKKQPQVAQNYGRASFVPRKGLTQCGLRRSQNTCEMDASCMWIQDSLGRNYCKSHGKSREFKKEISPSNLVTSNNEVTPSPELKQKFALPTSRQISREQKEAMYPSETLDQAEKKMCRCLLEVTWDDLLKNDGEITKNPYGICNFTISRARSFGAGEDAENRSKLATMTTSGGCTKFANFDNFPTEFLYAFAKMREKTSKGKQHFQKVPSHDKFIQNPEKYRQVLLSQAKNYQLYA